MPPLNVTDGTGNSYKLHDGYVWFNYRQTIEICIY